MPVAVGAGVRVASGWPAGLNSRWLGKVKMSRLASRPSAVKSELPTCTCPPVPKEVSMLPSALNRASAPKVSGARLVPDGLSGDVLPADEYFPVWLDQDGLGALHAGVEHREGGGDQAARSEALVQRAVGAEPDDRERAARPVVRGRLARPHQLAVGLDGQARMDARDAEVRQGGEAAVAERGVRGAVRQEPRQSRAGAAGPDGDHDVAV